MRTERRKNGWEQDAFTRFHHLVNWRPGERKLIKRQHQRAVRRTTRTALKAARYFPE